MTAIISVSKSFHVQIQEKNAYYSVLTLMLPRPSPVCSAVSEARENILC